LAISRYASEHVKVVLSGEGADELFGGYWYTEKIPRHQHTFRFVPDSVFDLADNIEPYSPFRKQTLRYFSALKNNDTAIYNAVQQFDMPAERYLESNMDWTEDSLYEMIDATKDNVSTDDFNSRMTAFDIKHWLPDDLLFKVDQSSMAASLEARVPFLDHNMVEFAYSIPTKFKRNGYKPVLNRAMSDLLPERTRNREKHGFGVPVTEWFRENHYAVTKWMDYDRIAAAPYVNADQIHKLWKRHKNGTDNSRILWKALTYVAWYHRIVKGAKQ
jgi:asparagine synthase (glutamine-hydrolysing)